MRSKLYVLMALFGAPLTFARGALTVDLEVVHPVFEKIRKISVAIEYEKGDSVLLYEGNGLRVRTVLLSETDTAAVTEYMIDVKNVHDEYERLFAPVLIVDYDHEALVEIGKGSTPTGPAQSLKITANAEKIS